MKRNDQFYTGKGTKRLLEEFRAAAGCRTTEQAVRAVFSIATTMTSDYLSGIRYHALEDGGQPWDCAYAVRLALFSPAFGDLIKQRDANPVPMTTETSFELGYLTMQVEKVSGLQVTFSDAFTLAVLMAKDVHDKFGNGQLVKIPLVLKKGHALAERHIHMAP